MRMSPVRVLMLILVAGFSGLGNGCEEHPAPFTALELKLRERSDALALQAGEFEAAEEFTAAADLYREAVEVLPLDSRNGSRIHFYRSSYASRNYPVDNSLEKRVLDLIPLCWHQQSSRKWNSSISRFKHVSIGYAMNSIA